MTRKCQIIVIYVISYDIHFNTIIQYNTLYTPNGQNLTDISTSENGIVKKHSRRSEMAKLIMNKLRVVRILALRATTVHTIPLPIVPKITIYANQTNPLQEYCQSDSYTWRNICIISSPNIYITISVHIFHYTNNSFIITRIIKEKWQIN